MALLDDLLRLFGTNRTRVRWKWERFKTRMAEQKSRAENRARVVTYPHKACRQCGHPADRFARRCVACGARLPSVVSAKLLALARILIDSDGGFAATSALLVANIAVFALMTKQLGTLRPSTAEMHGALLRWGAWTTVLPYDWPRWITSCFLHGGFMHLAFNMIALLQLGPVLEGIYGRRRFELIYVVSGGFGMAASTLWRVAHHQITLGVGASGAIFGIIGAASVYGLRRGGRIASEFRRQFLTWAGYAFLMGVVMGADNLAHAGGFIGGAAVAIGLADRNDARPAPPWLWALCEIGLLALLAYAGWHVWTESAG
jgi:rhomboid protease GluP